ncbi:MAG TPA: ATP-binding protein [Acidimicrobiales bacterium]
MTRTPSPLRTFLTPLVVLLVGLGITTTGAVVQVDAHNRADRRQAEAGARQMASLIESVASSFEASLISASAIAATTGGNSDAYRTYLDESLSFGSPILIEATGGELRSLPAPDATNGPDGISEALLGDIGARAVLERVASNPMLTLGRSDVPSPQLLIAAGASVSGRTMITAVTFPLGFVEALTGNDTVDVEAAALYATSTPDPDQVIYATEERLPLTGVVAQAVVEAGGTSLAIEVRPVLSSATFREEHLVALIGAAVSLALAGAALVTSRRRAETAEATERLGRAEERFRLAMAVSPDIVMLIGAESIDMLNRPDLLGHRPDDLIGGGWEKLVHPDDADVIRTITQRAQGHDGDPAAREFRMVDADGAEQWLSIRVADLPDTTEDDRQVLAVLTVVTEAHLAAERERSHRQELQQAQRMEAIGQLAGGVAHDFNNLLAAILTTAELLADDITEPRALEDLEEIREAARRGAALTGQLLAFSRRDLTQTEPLDLGEVVGDMSRLLRRTIGENIDLQLVSGDEPLPVVADRSGLEQVLLNLAVNARDAMASGGTLEIKTSISSIITDELVEVPAALLEVTDTGGGMTAEVRERAFEPFFTARSGQGGTGLGLAIVYGVVQRCGGQIGVDSEVGQGTTVHIRLPLDPDALDPATDAGVPMSLGDVSPETVLLVEDEAAVRRATVRLLQGSGHHVKAAATGEEALQTLSGGFTPTVLLTDVVLPGSLNGRDVAETVHHRFPEVRIVFMSGYSQELVDAEIIAELGSVFLAKPFDRRALLDSVSPPTPASDPR